MIDLQERYPGIVTPAHFHAPEYAYTLGGEIADVCRHVNYGPDPEQALGLDVIFARRHDHKSAVFEFGCIACRQNLKTGLFKQTAIGWLYVTDERLVIWSAHEFSTAMEALRDLEEIIAGSDYLRRRTKRITHGNGDEGIETTTGGRLMFKARTSGGGRGLSGRKVILDEGFALQPSHMGALLPTLSAQPDPQVIYGSSAGKPESAVLRGVRDRGRAGRGKRLAYLEYCAPDPDEVCERGKDCDHRVTTPGCGCDREELWRGGNPALGRRIMIDTVRGERDAMPPEEFGRERMGWWDDPVDGVRVITAEQWKATANRAAAMLNPVGLAFDVRPGNLSAAICAVGRLDVPVSEDLWRMEITGRADDDLDDRPGTDWLVERLVAICRKAKPVGLGYDPGAPAGAFEKALLEHSSGLFVKLPADERPPVGKVRLVPLTAREYGQACGATHARVTNGTLLHFDQRPLTDAVEGARPAPLGDAWKWSRKDSTVNITSLVGATIAEHVFASFGGEKPKPKPWAMSV